MSYSLFLINCQATPQPKPHHTPRTRHSPVGGLELHVSIHAPNPSPTILHGLRINNHHHHDHHHHHPPPPFIIYPHDHHHPPSPFPNQLNYLKIPKTNRP
ncbi:hypothetical protein Hanom_Chr00s001013g01671401 [Helianthus anomalus]